MKAEATRTWRPILKLTADREGPQGWGERRKAPEMAAGCPSRRFGPGGGGEEEPWAVTGDSEAGKDPCNVKTGVVLQFRFLQWIRLLPKFAI